MPATRPISNSLSGWFCALLIGLTASAAAEPFMRADLADATIAANSTTYINVLVTDTSNPGDPQIEVEAGDAKGIRTELISRGAQRAQMNNRIVQAYSFRFAVAGLEPGDYKLTSILVINGENFASDPMELTVREQTEAEKALEPKFSIRPGKSEIFLGEMLPLNLVISTNPRTRLQQFIDASPEVESNGFVMQPVATLRAASQPDSDGNDLHFFSTSCEPLRTGDLTLGPATYTIQILIPRGNFGQNDRRRIDLVSEPLTIKVKPLPGEGKPKSFGGSVGKFNLDVTASPTRLQQGEPISVSVIVSGEGNLPSIDMPALTGSTDGWKQYDPNRVDSRDANRDPRFPQGNSGRVTFVQMLVPLEPMKEIPPYEFSFFDPDTATYKTLRSDAIPIEVTEVKQNPKLVETQPNATLESAPRRDPPQPKTPPVEEMTDILTIRDSADQKWVGARKPLLQSKLFWTLQVPPATALLALIFVAAGRRINSRQAAPAWEGTYPPCAEILRKLEQKPKDARQFYQQANQFIEAWEEQAGADSVTALDSERRQAIREIRNRHNFLSFGSPTNGEPEKAVDTDERNNVIRTLKSLPGHA